MVVSVFSQAFDEAYGYDGDDLGCHWTAEASSFCLWAPTASEAVIVFYETWNGPIRNEIPMERTDRGVWRAIVHGNLLGVLYTYKVKIGDDWNEAVDPYVRAVSLNGDRGAIIDLSATNPDHWNSQKPPMANPTDAIIYELHIRDLSIHPHSGIFHNGKYLGAIESGTIGPNGISTGFDHIRRLGVTHVQLLPVFDYSSESVDESLFDAPQYNWGYDPKNYNAPEGSYSTNPSDPTIRILELKKLVRAYHDNGIRIIMDVVYNHMYNGYRANFTKLVPGYYFRYTDDGSFSNGSGCGNDIASERRMVRKFIVDSVVFWAKEYHMDGFRFDLMGLLDIDTINEIRRRLDEIDPTILMIGEGWDMGTELSKDRLADQANAAKLPRIGQFNDFFRDAMKGSVFFDGDIGFVSGKKGQETDVKRGIAGGIPYFPFTYSFAEQPDQNVNFVEVHDNRTLWDKLLLSNSGDLQMTRTRIHKLATTLLLTCQGIVLLHAGQEFMRTKQGIENSYRSSDEINALDWERCAFFHNEVESIRKMIGVRKKHSAFRIPTAEAIRKHLVFEQAPTGSIAFTLREHANGDIAKHLFVVHNANRQAITVEIPLKGPWSVEYGVEHAGPFDRVKGGLMTVASISTVVMAAWDGPAEYYV